MVRMKVHPALRLKNGAPRGFSLVELMIVLSVMSILALVTIPAVMAWLPNQRCKAAARHIYGSFQKAKVTAVKTNVNCAITFNQPLAGTTYDYVVYTDTNGDFRYTAGEPLLDQVQLRSYPGIQFDTSNPDPADHPDPDGDGLTFQDNGDPAAGLQPTIAFQPSTIPTDSGGGVANGSVFIRNNNGLNYRITVSQSGNVAIENLL